MGLRYNNNGRAMMKMGRKTLMRQLYSTTNEGAKLAEVNVKLAEQRDKARRVASYLLVAVLFLLGCCTWIVLLRWGVL